MCDKYCAFIFFSFVKDDTGKLRQTMCSEAAKQYIVSQDTQTPVTFWHNFTNTALMSVILGTENLRLILN